MPVTDFESVSPAFPFASSREPSRPKGSVPTASPQMVCPRNSRFASWCLLRVFAASREPSRPRKAVSPPRPTDGVSPQQPFCIFVFTSRLRVFAASREPSRPKGSVPAESPQMVCPRNSHFASLCLLRVFASSREPNTPERQCPRRDGNHRVPSASLRLSVRYPPTPSRNTRCDATRQVAVQRQSCFTCHPSIVGHARPSVRPAY